MRIFGGLVVVSGLLFGCSGDDNGDGSGSASGSENEFGNATPADSADDDASGDQAAGAGAGTPGAAAAGDLTSDNACAVGRSSADLAPVNMLVMFDRSRSMDDNAKWPNATAALKTFFQNPGADGLRVALRFFPHDTPATGCSEAGCDASACSQPLVDIGTLIAEAAPTDAQEGSLVSAIDGAAPGGGTGGGRDGGGGGGGQGTPMHAALDGALIWAMAYQAAHPEENTVVILVTDGEPNGCNENIDDIAQLAASALASSGVTTYAIGLEGSSEGQMDQIAQAGGTGQGIFIGNSAGAEQELLDALDAIRGETLSCEILMPSPADMQMEVDPSTVNVTFTAGDGTASTFGQVPNMGACASARAWYYDDPQAPARIVLCPAACDTVVADPDARLEILLGCATACGGLDVDCGGQPPGGGQLPPIAPPI